MHRIPVYCSEYFPLLTLRKKKQGESLVFSWFKISVLLMWYGVYMKSYGYVDGANLDRGAKALGVDLDYKKFYGWMRQKYKLDAVYLFLGLVPRYVKLYEYLQQCGFILIFKETVANSKGEVKGNCDAELVLKMISQFYEQDIVNHVLVSGDGDFRCVVDFLTERKQDVFILAPDKNKCSVLLKRTSARRVYLNEHYHKFDLK